MRYLKIYESYQTEKEVSKICKKYRIKNWSINQEGLVDVNGDVILSHKGLTELPLKFGIVTGGFDCSANHLTTLEGAPYSVVRGFYCSNNKLTALEGAPYSVGSSFYCYNNNLTTLEGAPQSVSGDFSCFGNNLTTLEGAPQSVSGDFSCFGNNLTTLEGAPYSVGGDFWCNYNPLPLLIKKNITWVRHIIANQEMYHIYNKDGSLNEYRFRLMMDSMD